MTRREQTPESSGRIVALITVWAISVIVAWSGHALAEPTAREIMEKNFFVTKTKTLTSDATMVLINDKGQRRERKSTTTSKLQSNGVDSKLLVKFLLPTDIKGTAFLQIEHSDGEDDLWIYLPALKKSRRLVANNKKDSFVGSDFSYGDILLPKVDLYQHTLIRSEVVDGHDCYVIESIPRDETVKRDSGYSKKMTWVRKDNFLETKVTFLDPAGRSLKTEIVGDHEQVESSPDRWIARRREMDNHQTGHKTLFTFDRVEVGKPVPDEFFTTRSIERE
ncbi:MAG: outer membrane lipoprotein-sorting protein [Nitrospirae bacterium]|nr:outer membrane lipoprotein-sorting protein [Nitrospirota bacterium]